MNGDFDVDEEFEHDDDDMFADFDDTDDLFDDDSSVGTAEAADDAGDQGDQGDWQDLTTLFITGDPDRYRTFLYHTPPSDATAAFWYNPDGEWSILSQAIFDAYSIETVHSATIRRMLHQEGADIMFDFGMTNVNTLQQAIDGGKVGMIRDYRLFAEPMPAKVYPPLIHACRNNDLATVHMLLSVSGIHVNDVGPNGNTALHEATCTPIVALLSRHPGVDVNVLDGEGWHPLHNYCLSTPASQHVNPMMERADLLVNLKDKYSYTALMYAVQYRNINAAKQLLGCPDIDITIQDGYGRTAFARVDHDGLTVEEFVRVWEAELLEQRGHLFSSAPHGTPWVGKASSLPSFC